IVAFFESVKYTGHLIPIAFLRVYMGYYYLTAGLAKYQGEFLNSPSIRDFITEGLAFSTAPHWYQEFLSGIVVDNWQICSWLVAVLQILIGVSFLTGYLVRPFSIVAMISSLVVMSLATAEFQLLEKTFLSINFMLCWIGAGRCLGLDYYFYKRMRGILW
ncbi:MAG: DoxX family membrane protein, partial [Bdellovibrionales bacterium]|nr:DoxX family membrane protein [Bdellovibrionales bacterium]